jgi:hypothetical protein
MVAAPLWPKSHSERGQAVVSGRHAAYIAPTG